MKRATLFSGGWKKSVRTSFCLSDYQVPLPLGGPVWIVGVIAFLFFSFFFFFNRPPFLF